MQETHAHIITRLRHQIAKRYFMLGWIAGGCWVLFMFLQTWFSEHPFPSALFRSLNLLSFLLMVDMFYHRYRMLLRLDARYPDAINRIRSYMEGRMNSWEGFQKILLITGIVVFLSMVFLLIQHAEARWTALASSLLVFLALGAMLKNWMNFLDQIFLHDVERSLKDQAPDISI